MCKSSVFFNSNFIEIYQIFVVVVHEIRRMNHRLDKLVWEQGAFFSFCLSDVSSLGPEPASYCLPTVPCVGGPKLFFFNWNARSDSATQTAHSEVRLARVTRKKGA